MSAAERVGEADARRRRSRRPRSRRPTIRIFRIAGGALLDTARRAGAVAPMAAFAFTGPWFLLVGIGQSFPRDEPLIVAGLACMAAAMMVLAAAMQSLLVESATTDLRRIRPNFSLDLMAVGRRFLGDLAANLIALALTTVSALVVGFVVGVSRTVAAPGDPNSFWWALGGAGLGLIPAAALMSAWAAAIPVSHVEGVGVVSALQRSVVLTRGQRLRIAVPQAVYLMAWPATLAAVAFAGARMHLRGQASQYALALMFFLFGVLAAAEALAKVRLYRELVSVEGAVGAASLAEMFE